MKKFLVLGALSLFCFGGDVCEAMAVGAPELGTWVISADAEIDRAVLNCLIAFGSMELQASYSNGHVAGTFENFEEILRAPQQMRQAGRNLINDRVRDFLNFIADHDGTRVHDVIQALNNAQNAEEVDRARADMVVLMGEVEARYADVCDVISHQYAAYRKSAERISMNVSERGGLDASFRQVAGAWTAEVSRAKRLEAPEDCRLQRQIGGLEVRLDMFADTLRRVYHQMDALSAVYLRCADEDEGNVAGMVRRYMDELEDRVYTAHEEAQERFSN